MMNETGWKYLSVLKHHTAFLSLAKHLSIRMMIIEVCQRNDPDLCGLNQKQPLIYEAYIAFAKRAPDVENPTEKDVAAAMANLILFCNRTRLGTMSGLLRDALR